MICRRPGCDKVFIAQESPSDEFCSEFCQRSWAVANTATKDPEPVKVIPEADVYPLRPVGPDANGQVPWWEKRREAA